MLTVCQSRMADTKYYYPRPMLSRYDWLSTMLAEDLGVREVPKEHPDATRFPPEQFQKDTVYDLVLCDGQVLRTQHREHPIGKHAKLED